MKHARHDEGASANDFKMARLQIMAPHLRMPQCFSEWLKSSKLSEIDLWPLLCLAMAGVTDALMEMGRLAQEGDDRYVERVIETKRRHKEAAEVLLNEKELADFETFLTRQMRDVEDLLRAVALAHHFSEASADLISGYGELLSARLLTSFLRSSGTDAAFCDAREVLTITHQEVGPVPLWEESQKRLEQWQEERTEEIWVVTGYIAADNKGAPQR